MAVPLKYDVVVDPFTIWGFAWKGSPLLADTLTGYRKLYLSNTSEFIFGIKSEILLQKKNSNELGGYQKDAPKAVLKKALEVWGIVVGTLVITEIGVMGVVADVWNTEEVSSTIVDVAAGLIVAECVTMQGKLSSACMKANRIIDVLKNTAPPVVVLS